MNGFLVRIAFDQTYGGWNAPVDPVTGEFVYLPIPESDRTEFQPGLERRFEEISLHLQTFAARHQLVTPPLPDSAMHLDPDFQHLTYGDDGSRRGAGLKRMSAGDFIAFYAGLQPVSKCEHNVMYALVGFYEVEAVLPIATVPSSQWHANAHTRKLKHYLHDIVITAKRESSGRFQRCLPIGEWRSGAYRVRNDLLDTWGGLSVKDGFIQRSAVPPSFLKPERFREWLNTQKISLVDRNN